MLYTLALLAVFVTVFLLALAFLQQRDDPAVARIRGLARYKSGPQQPSELTRPFAERVVLPSLTGVASLISAVLPTRILQETRNKLVMAGSSSTLNSFLLVWALLTLLLPALFLVLLITSGSTFGAFELFLLVGLAFLGAVLPQAWLSMAIHRRQKVIWKSLPDAFDLITASVEAGLGLDAALARVAERVPGPFARELNITLREVAMGKPRRDALKDLSSRTGVSDLSTFVNAVTQAEQMGVSIGPVLRTQADQLRTRRKQRAEQAGRRAAIFMIFPVIVFNLPALFIVAIGPAAINLLEALGE